jgi:D-inositol-3-phosphate glycosyltransferase
MRILFVTHYAVPHVGGIEFVVHHLASELATKGHDVAVVSSDAFGRDAVADDTPPDGYRLVRVPAVNALEERLGVPYPLFSPRLVTVLRRELASAEVVHAHGFLYMGTIAAMTMAGARHARVLTEHVGHVDYASRVLDTAQAAAIHTLGRLSARRAHALVLYNAKVRAEVSALAPRVPVHSIQNGVDEHRFRPPSDEERARLRAELGWDESPRVLFAGRPVAKKGFDVALDVARRVADEFTLAVAGPSALPHDAPANTELLGPLPIQRLAEVYRASDAILMPSRGEGFPLTAAEAMASGLPLVITDDPGYRDILAGAGPGVRLEPLDADVMAATLRELLGDATVRAEAARETADFARRRFSWRRTADEHEQLYAMLLAGRR